MPALVLPDVFVLFAAAFCFLCSVALTYLLKAIASKLPNLSILGVGLDLAKWFQNMGDDAIGFVVDSSKALWTHIETWVQAHVLMLEQFGGAVVQAVESHAGYIAHIVTSIVPAAIAQAERESLKAAEGLVNGVSSDIRSARTKLEAALGAEARSLYHKLAHDASSVEHDITSAVASGVDHAVSVAKHDLALAKTYTDHAEHTAEAYAKGLVDDLSATLGGEIAKLSKTVASDYASAKAIAQQDAADALTTAKGLINDAISTAENTAEGYTDKAIALVNKAIDATNTTVSNLTSTVASNLTTAEQYAVQQVAGGLSDVTQLLSGTAAVVGGAIGAAASGVASDIAGAEAAGQKAAADALAGANQAIDQALGDIYQDLTGTAAAAGADVTTLAGGIAAAITGSMAGVLTRVAKLEQCSVGVCSDSPNNFGNLLQQALGVASLVGFGAWLESAMQDPASTARQTVGWIGGAEQQAQNVWQSLLNL